MSFYKFDIDKNFDGKEAIDLLNHIGCSKKMISCIKRSEGLKINGKVSRTVDFLHSGDIVTIDLNDESSPLQNPSLNVPILYEDENVVVFDKPPYMPVHEALNHYNDTLANFFAFKYPGLTFRSINRLDRNTSGLCIVAKSRLSASRLCKASNLKKTYYAVVSGEIKENGVIRGNIARREKDGMLREVREDGQYAETMYKVLKSSKEASLLEISLKTGRTHQIRVHFSFIGHPLFGDDLYGGDVSFMKRQALHCGKLEFFSDGIERCVTSDFPSDINELCGRLFHG